MIVSQHAGKPVKANHQFAVFFAKMFYRIINKMSGTEIVDGARDFRFMTRKFVDAVLSLSEYNRFSKGIFFVGWI